MASAAAMMIGGAITNALAFSGSNYLFSRLGRKGDIDEETERHDKAMEELDKARDEFNKQRTERMDFLSNQRLKQIHAEKDFEDTEQAGRKLYEAKHILQEPKLSDFYTPSEDQKNREYIFIFLGIAVTGVIAWTIHKM